MADKEKQIRPAKSDSKQNPVDETRKSLDSDLKQGAPVKGDTK